MQADRSSPLTDDSTTLLELPTLEIGPLTASIGQAAHGGQVTRFAHPFYLYSGAVLGSSS